MLKHKIMRNPVVISTAIFLFLAATIAAIYILWLDITDKFYLWIALGAVTLFYSLFQITLWLKKKSNNKALKLETEEEALAMVIRPLLAKSNKKPIYLMIGNKYAGRTQFLLNSSAIKPMDQTRTAKNDFFEWYESDSAVYIKPDQRLLFQEVSSNDSALWDAFVNEVIKHKPRKPFSGCLFFIDFEFLIVSETEQIDYTLTALNHRLESVSEKTSSAIPLYLMMSK
ncbi:type VI secretion protein IcmF/TssM N-terminal domain-containing protein, partial [Vibrio splendidus]